MSLQPEPWRRPTKHSGGNGPGSGGRAGLVALVLAAPAVVALGLLHAYGNRASCDGPCPADPTGPDDTLVNDQFSLLHQDLGATAASPSG